MIQAPLVHTIKHVFSSFSFKTYIKLFPWRRNVFWESPPNVSSSYVEWHVLAVETRGAVQRELRQRVRRQFRLQVELLHMSTNSPL